MAPNMVKLIWPLEETKKNYRTNNGKTAIMLKFHGEQKGLLSVVKSIAIYEAQLRQKSLSNQAAFCCFQLNLFRYLHLEIFCSYTISASYRNDWILSMKIHWTMLNVTMSLFANIMFKYLTDSETKPYTPN